jgi:integrase
VVRKEVRALSPVETRALLFAAHVERLEALYVLAVHTGLRQGELLGLRWEDANLETGKLRVVRQVQRMRDGGGLVFAPLKNAKSRRTIAITASAVEALRRQRARQAEEKLRAGGLYRDGGLMFATESGTPLDAQNVVNRSFKPLLERAGLPRTVRFHDLRHTSATLLLSQGVNPKIAQERLGHANISMTMDTYSHVMPDMQEQAAAAMDAALS